MDEIAQSDADLVCLQEVDHYADIYKPFLTRLGYEFYTEWRKEDDACLLGFKKDKFEFIDKLGI